MFRNILILIVLLILGVSPTFAQNELTAKTDTNTINKLFNDYLKLRDSEPQKAMECLQNGILIARQIKSTEKMALLLYHKGYLFRTLGAFNLAMSSNISALELYDKLGDKNERSWLMIDIGWVYLESQKNYTMALNHFTKAKETFQELHNNIGTIVANHDIGNAYSEMGKFDQALIYFNEASELSIKIKEKRHQADSYALLGRTYYLLSDETNSRKWFSKAKHLYETIKCQNGIANAYADFAALETKLNHKSIALSYCDSALSSYSKFGNKAGMTDIYLRRSSIYLSQENIKKAIESALAALNIADKNQLLGQQLQILPIISDYFAKQNDLKQSYAFLKRYYDLKESNSVRYAQQLETEYAFQNELQEKRLQEEIDLKRLLVIAFLSVGLVVVLALSTLIFFKNLQLKESYKHLYKNSVELHEKEQELAEINKQSKYNRSMLKNEQQQTLLNELLELMENKKIFLQNDLSLDDFAKQLNTNRTYISQIINDSFNTNFSNFINDYRVQEAKEIFLHASHKYLTIEAIAQKVGFNSKSSFNTAFKKFTGLTPSNFMEMNTKANKKIADDSKCSFQ